MKAKTRIMQAAMAYREQQRRNVELAARLQGLGVQTVYTVQPSVIYLPFKGWQIDNRLYTNTAAEIVDNFEEWTVSLTERNEQLQAALENTEIEAVDDGLPF